MEARRLSASSPRFAGLGIRRLCEKYRLLVGVRVRRELSAGITTSCPSFSELLERFYAPVVLP